MIAVCPVCGYKPNINDIAWSGYLILHLFIEHGWSIMRAESIIKSGLK